MNLIGIKSIIFFNLVKKFLMDNVEMRCVKYNYYSISSGTNYSMWRCGDSI